MGHHCKLYGSSGISCCKNTLKKNRFTLVHYKRRKEIGTSINMMKHCQKHCLKHGKMVETEGYRTLLLLLF